MNKLKLFQENDVESLYHMAKHLYCKTSFFRTYLTVPQLSILNKIFGSNLSKNQSKLIWQYLLNGKLLIHHTHDKNHHHHHHNDNNNSEDGIDNASFMISKSMCLRIRSLLWGKAASYYYHLSDNNDKENEIFEILEGEDSDFEDAPMNPEGESQSQSQSHLQQTKQQPQLQQQKSLRADDEDDDYDEDDEEEKEEEQKEQKENDKANQDSSSDNNDTQSSSEDFKFHDGYLVLDIQLADLPDDENNLNGTPSINNHSTDSRASTTEPNDINKQSQNGKPATLTTTKMSTSLNSSDTIVTTQELQVIKSLNNVYHNFENDRETLLKRQKLEANDKIVNEEPKTALGIATSSSALNEHPHQQQSLSQQLSMNIGSASLSLKYLLKLIDNNKEKVPNLTSRELRNLIHDVKKSKSKWSSEDRIGQEELYEACEKVVIELRSYTQHSTPFLTRVSKREAPNYYQIIKKPMDLNTVMRKLKNLEYKSKQGFIDDLMLIWSNCFTYNTDPNHQLRKDAIAMRKKTLSFVPLIPDIVVRTKAEIEKEEKEIELKEKKDQNLRSGGQVSLKKGLKRTSNGAVVSHGVADSTASPQPSAMGTPTPSVSSAIAGGAGVLGGKGIGGINNNDGGSNLGTNNGNTPEPLGGNAAGGGSGGGGGDDEADESQADLYDQNDPDDDNYNVDDNDEINGGEGENDNDNEIEENNDLEIQVWKNYTSKLRGDFLLRRSGLFIKDENNELKLNDEAEAVLRDPVKMAEFMKVVQGTEFNNDDANVKDGDSDGDGDGNGNGNGDGLSNREYVNGKPASGNNNGADNDGKNKQQRKQSGLENAADLEGGDGNDNDENGINDDLYLTEYDVINGIPLIKYKGQDEEHLSKEENKILEKLKFQRKLHGDKALEDTSNNNNSKDSQFVSPKNGLNKVILDNISQMQDIRKICFKISLIRQMQQNQFIHHTQLKPPVFEKLRDFDLDPLEKKSEDVVFDHKFNGPFIYSIFRKNISKILMNTGFEAADPLAVDAVAQIAETFLGNLIKTIKMHLETNSHNRMTSKSNILLLSLVENGIPKPDDLFIYVKEGIIKQNAKLKELRHKLANFLKELLRPSLMTFQSEKELINERNFSDDSEQFLTGDFSNELGEDFFGFKELGLDKEFQLLSSSIPLHLLNSRLNSSFFNAQSASAANQNLIEEFDKNIKHERLKKQDIASQIRLLEPFLNKVFEKSKSIFLKNFKNNNTANKELPLTNKEEEMVILEDEDLPQKQRNIRPRLPPNGKIAAVKKRSVANSFFLSEEDEESEEGSETKVKEKDNKSGTATTVVKEKK